MKEMREKNKERNAGELADVLAKVKTLSARNQYVPFCFKTTPVGATPRGLL